jgi:hypothetical protein
MATLADFPIVSQRTPITSDGRPSENAPYDCVAASIGAMILWYQGKTQWDDQINPDRLKDAAYGEAYMGGTDAARYVEFCKSLGFSLWVFKGENAVLVNEAHKQLQAGHPVMFTEPDPYVSASLGWTHVCVFYGETNGGLVALDPYIAKPISRTDGEWEVLLQYGAIWILEKEDEMVQPLTITMPEVAALFVEVDKDHWQSKATGKILQYGLKDDYVKNGIYSLLYLGDIISNEIYIGPQVAKQHYERGVRVWSNGSVMSLDLYAGPGQDPLIKKLQDRFATALQLVNALLKEMTRPL